MPTPKPPYPAPFRQQMVELVQAGRTPAQLAREFGVSGESISTWVAQAAVDRGKDVLSSAAREELVRLRRQVRQLQTERDILAMAAAWFAAKGEKTSGGATLRPAHRRTGRRLGRGARASAHGTWRPVSAATRVAAWTAVTDPLAT
jgi:transposase